MAEETLTTEEVAEVVDSDENLRKLQAQARSFGLTFAGMDEAELSAAVEQARADREAAKQRPEQRPGLDASIEAQVTQMGKQTAAALRREPQERVMVARDSLNRNDNYVWVGLNGWNFRIEREQPVTLPVPVIELLEQGGYAVRRAR